MVTNLPKQHPPFYLYNTLTNRKELFVPKHSPHVGMYVCGPTVYDRAHIGHARSAIHFDVLYRYLNYLGYQVRYIRNITDVGHLVRENDQTEQDKIVKQAFLEQKEPMEIVQYYTNHYRKMMNLLNVLPPTIEPCASGHIMEQIEMIQEILACGLGYVVSGSVYFDLMKYLKQYSYGEISGRKVEDLLTGKRILDAQKEKKSPLDFALWKRAKSQHIMHWPSPWGRGFPGWHIECSAMSQKYLKDSLDIHGGGIDLMFPHHECEIAQLQAIKHTNSVKYWIHHNIVTIDNQKMSKSLGNSIFLEDLWSTSETSFHPMALRVLLLQVNYRSVVDFSTEALVEAEKLYYKFMNTLKIMKRLNYPEEETLNLYDKDMERKIKDLIQQTYAAMNDDLNTSLLITHLLSIGKYVHVFQNQQISLATISKQTFLNLKQIYEDFLEKILGIRMLEVKETDILLDCITEVYRNAKIEKDYATVEKIRTYLKKVGIKYQDSKQGIDWVYEPCNKGLR